MKTKVFLAGAFAERGTDEFIEGYEQAHIDAGAHRRLMAFGRKNGDKYAELFKTKIFLAGNTGAPWRERAALETGAAHRLWSFERKDDLVPILPTYGSWRAEHKLEVMLDSGAFSAHSKGVDIKLQDYADFIIKYADVFSVVVNLDVIPGKPGTGLNHDPKEAERAAEQGWRNWLDLRAALKPVGITPIPVYHLGEDRKWLKRMIAETDYIALGGIRHGTKQDKFTWLDDLQVLHRDALEIGDAVLSANRLHATRLGPAPQRGLMHTQRHGRLSSSNLWLQHCNPIQDYVCFTRWIKEGRKI